MSGGPKAVTASWDHDTIASIAMETGKLMSSLTLTFSDGSTVEVETPKANKPARLVEEAQKHRSGR